MPKIKQYRPGYFTGFENETKDFNSLEELFAIDFIDNFKKLPNNQVNPDFHQFSISFPPAEIGMKFPYILMAEYKNGTEWWVVGYITENNLMGSLPRWSPKKEKQN